MKNSHDNLNIYMREISRTPLLTREEERELGLKALKGDPAARDRMIRSNLRLVVKIAKDYSNYGLPLADLIAEGNVGLMKSGRTLPPGQRRKIQHLRRVVDQAMHQAGARQSGQDHPHAGARHRKSFQAAPHSYPAL